MDSLSGLMQPNNKKSLTHSVNTDSTWDLVQVGDLWFLFFFP